MIAALLPSASPRVPGCSACSRLCDAARVEDQRRRTVRKYRRAAEQSRHSARSVERLDHYLLLSDELVDDEADAALREVEDNHMSPVAAARWMPKPRPQPHRGNLLD